MIRYYVPIIVIVLLFLSLTGSCGEIADTSSVPTRSITLAWEKPTHDINSDLILDGEQSGFIIYLRSPSGAYTLGAMVNNADATSHTFSIPGGELYFVITAFNIWGSESNYSTPEILLQ